MVVCYHGNSGKHKRDKQETPSISLENYHSESLFFHCNCREIFSCKDSPSKNSAEVEHMKP